MNKRSILAHGFLMYGEVVTSTQTMLDRFVLMSSQLYYTTG